MAGDWIKMRPALVSDYRVVGMADHILKDHAFIAWFGHTLDRTDSNARYVTRNVTVALCVTALMRVWGAVSETADRNGDDAVMPNASLEALDCISGLPGFGSAMAYVKWVVADGSSLIFPKFLIDNTLKRERSDTAERQRRYRERQAKDGGALRNGNVTRVTKRREDKTNTPPTPQRTTPPHAAGGGGGVVLTKRLIQTRANGLRGAFPFLGDDTAKRIARLNLNADDVAKMQLAARKFPASADHSALLVNLAKEYAGDNSLPGTLDPPGGSGRGTDRSVEGTSEVGGAA